MSTETRPTYVDWSNEYSRWYTNGGYEKQDDKKAYFQVSQAYLTVKTALRYLFYSDAWNKRMGAYLSYDALVCALISRADDCSFHQTLTNL